MATKRDWQERQVDWAVALVIGLAVLGIYQAAQCAGWVYDRTMDVIASEVEQRLPQPPRVRFYRESSGALTRIEAL